MRNKLIICGIIVFLILITLFFNKKQIFGRDIVVFKEQKLINKVILIDPGHGGRDNGASYGNVNEDELNLKISFALKEELETRGAIVYLTREGDKDVTQRDHNYSKQDDMYLRALKIDSYNPDFFVSVHLNASTYTSAWGSQVFYYGKSTLGKLAAQIVHKHMKEVTGTRKNIQTGDFYILRSTGTVGILIECGFISNGNERGQLANSKYHKKLSIAISDGIEEYFQTEEYQNSSLLPNEP